MTHGDIPDDGGMDAAEFAKLMGGYPDPPMNPLYQTGGGFMDNPGGFAWVASAETYADGRPRIHGHRKCDCDRCERGRVGHYPHGWTCQDTGVMYRYKDAESFNAEKKDYKKAYNRLKGALYDEYYHRDIEDSCNCEYLIEEKLESGEITMEEAESDTPQCKYCVVMDVFEEYGAESRMSDKEFERRLKNYLDMRYGKEVKEAPYGGAGALMDIGKDTPLANFTDEELTKSSAIHGDFDTASLDYSGHQNIEVRAETDAYTYAYTEGHGDSRKREGFHPSMGKEDSKDFHQILRQKAEMESLTSDIVDVSNRIGETVGRVRVQDDKDDMEDVFVEVENEDGDVIMEGKLEDEWTPNMEDLDYYYGESFEAQGGIVGGIIQVEGGGVHWAMQPDNNPDVQWITDPNDPEGHTIAVPAGGIPPTGGESGNGGTEGGNGESTPEPAPAPEPQPEEGNGGGTEGGNGDTQEDANGGSDEGQQEEEQQGGQPPPHEEEQQGSGGVDALAAEAPTSFLTILLGTTATLIGLGLLSKKLKKKAEFHNETDEPTEEPELIMSPNIGDLDPAQYEELVVESTGYAVDVIPMGLDGSFMGSRFNALPTDRFIDYNEPGIGAHIDIALTRNENFREPEQSMVQASETEVKESQAPGQSPYFQMGHEPVDMNYRVLKETTTVSLDPAVRAFIPQSMSGYTGQKYAPPSVYEKMFGLGVSGITPAFVSGESDMGANRFGSRDAKPDRLSNVGGPLSDSVNAGYTDGNTTISLAQWSIENQVQPVSDTEAIVIDRSSGARKMIRRV